MAEIWDMVPSQTWHIPGCLCSSPSFTSAFWEKREGVCMTVWEGRTYKADSACEAASSFKPRVLSSQSLSTGQQQQHQDQDLPTNHNAALQFRCTVRTCDWRYRSTTKTTKTNILGMSSRIHRCCLLLAAAAATRPPSPHKKHNIY